MPDIRSRIHQLDANADYGSYSGCVLQLRRLPANRNGNTPTGSDVRDYALSYLDSFIDNSDGVLEFFNGKSIAILESLHVEPNSRGKGLGTRLIGHFMKRALTIGIDGIVLVADLGEEQAQGFSLKEWYEAIGFESVQATTIGDMMVCPDTLADQLKQHLRVGPVLKVVMPQPKPKLVPSLDSVSSLGF